MKLYDYCDLSGYNKELECESGCNAMGDNVDSTQGVVIQSDVDCNARGGNNANFNAKGENAECCEYESFI